MTVLYASRDRALWTRRDDPEPSLAELLDDPALHALMARDGIDRPTLEAVIADAQRKLGLGDARRSTLEATLFAECWTA
jgi:hypothetical protein